MNHVSLIGRLTKDPVVRYMPDSQTAVATFSLAVDRPVKQGQEKKADFPRVTVFGKQAENCERYISKGSRVGIEGRIQTGSYQDKNGQNVYTTDVIANRVEFLDSANKNGVNGQQTASDDIPEGFMAVPDDDCPFWYSDTRAGDRHIVP